MRTPNCLFFALYLVLNIAIAQDKKQNIPTERLSFDKGWKFHKGDIPFPVIKGHGASYNNAKAGAAGGAASPSFDDTEWRLLNLPHDWAVENPYDEKENISQGYRARGFGWYRRKFNVDSSDRGKHIEIQFDGVATNCTVWVNGIVVHRNWCGYTSFYIDVSALLKYGKEPNTIAIRVDAESQEGWWYEGAGIYRHTWLVKRSSTHIIQDGVYANPVKMDAQNWQLPIEVKLENIGTTNSSVLVSSTLIDKAGKTIARGASEAKVGVLDTKIVNYNIDVINPKLWSVDEPTLYKVQTTVTQNGKIIDSVSANCGFRTIRFDKDSGFYLNGNRLKIKGVCNHQDHAGVGVAVPNALWEFRIRKLKEMGVNGYRCSHNPPAKEFLDACDRMGLLVMDENRNFNSSPEYVRQLEWMVRRDRNHPSIILWSVFNEEPMQGTEIGYEMVRRMSAVVKKLDQTRPVTAAMNGGLFTPMNVSKAVDVVGFNYQIGAYDNFHKTNPDMVLTSSEDVSGIMTRDEYVTDKKRKVLASYDDEKPAWGSTHRVGWKAIDTRAFLAGCFVWTGFDYRGEPTPYTWPAASSQFGIMDVCGFPKAAFYIHKAQWIPQKPALQLIPHWNWSKDSIGKSIKVMALTNVDKVKLLLNGKLIEEKLADKYEMVAWQVPYSPGKLEAIGYKNDKEVIRNVVETTSDVVALQLVPDRSSLKGDGWDVMPVTVQAIDAKGRVVPTANLMVQYEISGAGTILGFGNGDPNVHEMEKGTKYPIFNGLAQSIIQSKEGQSGNIILTAKAEGLRAGMTVITVDPAPSIPFVPLSNSFFSLEKWRMSPVFAAKPDPNLEIPDNDQNSWFNVQSGKLNQLTNGSFAIYRAILKPYSVIRKNGGEIVFESIVGKAEIYVNKQLVGTKTNPDDMLFAVKVPPAENYTVSVLIEGQKGQKVGFLGIVRVEP
jgi:beta-galactosidase